VVEEKLVTWTCKLCGEYEVRDTERKALGKLVNHLEKEHPKKYADVLWKIANEMEPIKMPMPHWSV